MLRPFVLLVALVAVAAGVHARGAAAQDASTFTIVSAPSYILVKESDATMKHEDVAEVVCGSFGLQSKPASSHVTKSSPFNTPKSGLLVEFEGSCQECLPESLVAQFQLTETTSVAPLESITTRMTAVFGDNSMEHCHKHSNDISPLGDVAGLTVEGDSLFIGELEVDLSSSTTRRIVSQLAAIASRVSAFQSAQSPRVLTATLDVASVSATTAKLVNAVLSDAASKLAEQTNGNAVVTVHTQAPVVTVARRSVEEESPVAFVPNNANLTSHDGAWVEYCTTYKCFCSLDSQGNAWDPSTRCRKGCDEICSDCVWLGCSCDSASVMKSQSLCQECADGYVLHGNHCYLDTDMPAAVNIILWLGLALFVGLLCTCTSLANMDPGYDSIIYRMTRQRIKSH